MTWIINLVGKMSGVSGWISKTSPLLLSVSALLGALAHLIGQAASVSTTAGAIELLKGAATSPDAAVIALALRGIKTHFGHNDNVARIENLESKKDSPPAAGK